MKKVTLDNDSLWLNDLPDRPTARPQTLSEKVEESKRALRLGADMSKEYYHSPLIVTYSGGKDSDVMLRLAQETLEPHEYMVMNSHTTVDAPETVYHIRNVFKNLNKHGVKTYIDYHADKNGHRTTMWNLIPQRLMPPTRLVRYCCAVLKETGTPNKIASLGVREEESTNRSGRDIFGVRGGATGKLRFFLLTIQRKYIKKQKKSTTLYGIAS